VLLTTSSKYISKRYILGDDIMNINLKLTGVPVEVIEETIKCGYAASKTEAIRLALISFKDKLAKQKLEDELAVRKMQQMDEDIKSGKAKVLNSKEALGEYEKYLYKQ
jgi:Arc/MetJ-type ribon-helix-helix transcriptional regulator